MDNRLGEQVIHNLLSVMTLELIEELTTASMGVEKMSLTQMMEGKFSGVDLDPFSKKNRAKILPFESKEEDIEEIASDSVVVQTAVGDGISHSVPVTQELSKEIDSQKFKDPLYIEEPPEEVKYEHSTSDFILIEKERLKISQDKLKKKTVLETYHKVSSVDLEQEKANKDNLKNSANSGVLINKRQF